jgi:hypothetical protein
MPLAASSMRAPLNERSLIMGAFINVFPDVRSRDAEAMQSAPRRK